MILVDFSSIIHRKIYSSVADIKPKKVDGKFVTSEFIGLVKYYILQELFDIKQEHGNTYGDLVICLDKSDDGYWRKDFFPGYKSNRKKGREESEVNFQEVFKEIEPLIEQLKLNLPWKVVEVSKAEADDIMLVLAREYNGSEKILIHSPDKDMIQAQRNTENVSQYSSLTKKWIVPENKHDNMDDWILEHVCLGDDSDGVPKIVAHTEFSPSFIKHMIDNNIPQEYHNVYNFKHGIRNGDEIIELPKDDKMKVLSTYNVWKTNRKGEETELDVYKDMRFGPSTLHKEVAKYGSINDFLNTNPLYKEHYERNFILVMEEGIPNDIWNGIIVAFKEADIKYNDKEFETYLLNNELRSIMLELPNHFTIQRELTADDFGW